jgi:hypothetical protein
LPEKGPHTSEISLYTPYAQIVLNSWRKAAMYSAQQAEQDYRTLGDTNSCQSLDRIYPYLQRYGGGEAG